MARGKKTGGNDFKPGNPGRPKGSRNRLSERVIQDIAQHWEENGMEAIERTFQERPEVYLKTVASLLPKDMNVTHGLSEELSQLPDEVIKERLSKLYEQLGGTDEDTASVRTGERTH